MIPGRGRRQIESSLVRINAATGKGAGAKQESLFSQIAKSLGNRQLKKRGERGDC